MTDRRYEDDGGRPYVAPENPDAADEYREREDEREARDEPRYVCAACGRTSPSPDALTAVADPTTSYCGCGWIGGQG